MNRASVARVTRFVTVVGAAFVLTELTVQVTALRLGAPHLQWGLRVASDVEVLGIGLWWVAVATRLVRPRRTQ